MINTIEYKGHYYPSFQATGFAARFVFPFAQEVCRGVGFDIGCAKKEWSFPNSIPIDTAFKDEWNAMKLPDFMVDYIFSSHCLEHLPNWVDALDYWFTRIKPGGVLFLYLPHRSQEYWLPFNNRKHIHYFDGEILRKYFEQKDGITNLFISGVDLNNSFTLIVEKI